MSAVEQLLASRRLTLYERFRRLLDRSAPRVRVPEVPQDALELGYRLGLQAGYGEGLVDGVDLGVDAGVVMGPDDAEGPEAKAV